MDHNRKTSDILLEHKLEVLIPVAPRSQAAAELGKANFMQQVDKAADSWAVSAGPTRRHTGWKYVILSLYRRKERVPMFASLVTILAVVSLVFGGAGAAAYAAEDSLPGQVLYGLKTLQEDVRLETTTRTQARLELTLEYASRRVAELGELARRGETLPEPALLRLQSQLEHALQHAANLEDPQMLQAMEQIRTRLQEQIRMIDQLPATPSAEAAWLRVRLMVQTFLQLVEECQGEPQLFREQIHLREQDRSETNPGNGPGPNDASDNGHGYGPGRVSTQEPSREESSGYGPGPGPEASCTPSGEGGYGPGPGPENTQEPQPGPQGPQGTQEPQETQPPDPGPQEPGGPQGPAPSSTCTPERNGESGFGQGPQPSQPPGEGSGNRRSGG